MKMPNMTSICLELELSRRLKAKGISHFDCDITMLQGTEEQRIVVLRQILKELDEYTQ